MEKPVSSKSCSLQITRNYTASPEAVFQAWTDPKALMQWFAPSDTFTTPVAEVNLVVGGSYRIQMKDPSGHLHTVGGVYREISRPDRLVFTWAWEGGGRCDELTEIEMSETLVTVEFHQTDTGTELKLIHEQLSTEESRAKHEQGWGGCLTGLEKLVG